MFLMIDWTGRRLRTIWPPVRGAQIALLLCMAVGLVLEFSAPGVTGPEAAEGRAPLGSPQYALDGIGFILLIAQFVVLFLMPLTGVLLIAALAAALATMPGVAAAPAPWAIVTLVALAIAGWLLVAQIRPMPPARTTTPEMAVPFPETFAHRVLWPGLTAVGLALFAGAGLIAFHGHEMADVAAFEERAQVVRTQVLSVDDEYYVTVRIDGVEHELDTYWLDEAPEPFTFVDVLVDPEDPERVALVGSPEDPAWLLGVAALSPMAAWLAVWLWVIPPLQRRRLVARGGPVGHARIVNLKEHIYLLPTDATWPAMRLIRSEILTSLDHEAWEDDESEDWLDDNEFDDEESPDSPEEMRRQLDEYSAESQEDAEVDAATLFGPEASGPMDVQLIGTPRRGATVAYQHGGHTWLAELTDITGILGLRARLRRAVGAGGDSLLIQFIDTQPQLARILWALLCVVAAGGLSWLWLVDDPSDWLGLLVFLPTLAALPLSIPPGEGGVTLRRDSLVLHAILVDEVVPASRVRFVADNGELVGLRVVDPDDVLVLDPQHLLRRSQGTAAEATAKLESWRAGAAPARGGKRLSALSWGTIGVLLVAAISLVVT